MSTGPEHPPDESLAFLSRFVELFEDLLQHDGYGDLSVSVILRTGNVRQIVMRCGKEYRFTVRPGPSHGAGRRRRFKVIRT